MKSYVTTVLAAVVLSLSSAALVLAQTQPTPTQPTPTQPTTTQPKTTQTTTTTTTQTPAKVTKTVQNPDGTFTVIEYPVGKETIVTLNPVTIKDATGTATILRKDDGTLIKLNLTGVPKEVTALNLYAVDPAGVATLLGPITVADGVGTFTATAPLDKFMLIASPEASLTSYDPNTKIFFRSAVPEGFAVIPNTTNPVGEKVTATTTEGAATKVEPTTTKVTPAKVATTTTEVTPAKVATTTTEGTATKVAATTTEGTAAKVAVTTTESTAAAATYSVPMLNLPAYKKGDDTKMKVNFSGAMTGSRANVFITPRKDGPTEVRMRFHELKDAPAGKVFTLWAVSADNKFVKLGQIVNVAGRNEAEIKSEVALPDFGLLVTMEDAKGEGTNPLGPSIGIVEITKEM